ncbi:hypothetical protein ACF3DV_06710 [Chlorogloeopsis fritschii PCC 9212]|uniref:hypothetical protein n=1 Tax=Chlorogloeopsis fritschii TaxID=1124 RepID=UPI00030A2B9C|nr:hypothetical protein [Chlorogloeopsis fritschii]MBF2004384.1 hypothetical protein [Chlorogloeopsis fritschii C42_A2020_084]
MLKVNQTKLADNGFLTLGDNVETRSQSHGRIQTLLRRYYEFRVSTIYLCLVRVEI